jgi:hypothetical protein
MFSEIDIIEMLEFWMDNILAMFDEHVFQQTVCIHMGTTILSPINSYIRMMQTSYRDFSRKTKRSYTHSLMYKDMKELDGIFRKTTLIVLSRSFA